jgi:acyl carrier protein
MSELSTDHELWAARIRLHFEPPLRDAAEKVTRMFVPYVGSRIKDLRPETRMSELVGWMNDADSGGGSASLDQVELIMAIEVELESDITDEFAEHFEEQTFRQVVAHLAARTKAK